LPPLTQPCRPGRLPPSRTRQESVTSACPRRLRTSTVPGIWRATGQE